MTVIEFKLKLKGYAYIKGLKLKDIYNELSISRQGFEKRLVSHGPWSPCDKDYLSKIIPYEMVMQLESLE